MAQRYPIASPWRITLRPPATYNHSWGYMSHAFCLGSFLIDWEPIDPVPQDFASVLWSFSDCYDGEVSIKSLLSCILDMTSQFSIEKLLNFNG